MLSFVLPRHPDARHKAMWFAVACLWRTEWRLLPNQVRGLHLIEQIALGTVPATSFDPAKFGFIVSEGWPFASRFANTAFLLCQSLKHPDRVSPSVVAREAVEAAQAGLDPTLAIATVLEAES